MLLSAAGQDRTRFVHFILTFAAPTVTKLELWVKLQEDLLKFARVVKSEESVDADILWYTGLKVTLDQLILLILVSSKLTTQLDYKRGELGILEQL